MPTEALRIGFDELIKVNLSWVPTNATFWFQGKHWKVIAIDLDAKQLWVELFVR